MNNLSQPVPALEYPRVARFEKVPLETFKDNMREFLKENPDYKYKMHIVDDIPDTFDAAVEEMYNSIIMPKRSTAYSAGYDFFAPFNIHFNDDSTEVLTIPTGIRCEMAPNWVLALNVRSGHGFKYGIRLANTQGIIDSDYYDPDVPRTIMVKLVNESIVGKGKELSIPTGTAFVQGIFLPYGLTVDDNADGKRQGAFGSTDKK